MTHAPPSTAWAIMLIGGTLVTCVGCGRNSGPERYDVSGTVLYDGQPLESGRITFAPDADQGNKGPAGYAFITNGKYDTTAADGKSPVAGPMRVLLTGYNNGNGPNKEALPPLFEDFAVTATIDPEQSHQTLNFEVPKDGKAVKTKAE